MEQQIKQIDFLKKHEIFHNLNEEELQQLLPFIRSETVIEGHFIIREGDPGDDLYFIEQGSVEILKADQEHHTQYQLAQLHRDDCFGETAILGTKVRITSARALEKTELIALHLKDLDTLAQQKPAFSKIFISLAKKATQRLELANLVSLKSIKEELRLTQTHDQMGRFIIYLFILLTLFVYTLKFFELYGSSSSFSQLLVSAFILFFGISGILLVKQSGFPLAFYGLTCKDWQKHALEAFLYTIPLLIFMVVLKWVLIASFPVFNQLHLFEFNPPPHSFLETAYYHILGKSQSNFHLNLLLIIYTALVPVQEFIARGCLQSSLRNFFISPHRAFLAILTSNLLFGLFHGLKSFSFALAAFLLGMFWGWLYERQRTIIGPCVSHMMIGIWAFGVLNYQSILIY